MATYRSEVVRSATGYIIHLRFIESIIYVTDPLDQIIDKLKGQTVLIVKTVSGDEHRILLETILDDDNDGFSTVEDLAKAIIDKWSWLNSVGRK